MSDSRPADRDERKRARVVRQLRRQVALGVLLALLIAVDRYVLLGSFQPWVQHAQVWIAGALVLDVLVRPVMARFWPTFVIIGYRPREK